MHQASSLRRRTLLSAALAGSVSGRGASAQSQADPVHDLLAAQVEDHNVVGYVAALTGPTRSRVITAGTADTGEGRALDGSSMFEIGSITKVFTALLLMDMAHRGEVALADPVANYLPPEGRPPAFDGKPITLLDLVTYTSGLMRMPDNFKPADLTNPYADYTVAQLYRALSATPPRYYPGSHYEYSNLGFGLLGHVLALRTGRSYEDLIVSRICTPLALNSTRITLTPAMQERLVIGHDSGLRRAANWDLPTFAGAGALRSTADDLARFLDAAQGRLASPLAPAFATMLDVRRQTDIPFDVAAAGWFVRSQRDDELVWKDGGTGGYSSFIGYSTRSGHGVVLLANTASGLMTPAIGCHLLNAAFSVPELPRQVAIDPAKLAVFAGRFALTPKVTITATPKDGRLMVRLTGQDEAEVFPESDTTFFYRIVNAQLTFIPGADGMADAVILHQNGRNLRAPPIP